jgi:hypothetical protein
MFGFYHKGVTGKATNDKGLRAFILVKALADKLQFLPAKGMKRGGVGVVEDGFAAFHYPKPRSCECHDKGLEYTMADPKVQ